MKYLTIIIAAGIVAVAIVAIKHNVSAIVTLPSEVMLGCMLLPVVRWSGPWFDRLTMTRKTGKS